MMIPSPRLHPSLMIVIIKLSSYFYNIFLMLGLYDPVGTDNNPSSKSLRTKYNVNVLLLITYYLKATCLFT